MAAASKRRQKNIDFATFKGQLGIRTSRKTEQSSTLSTIT
jgi:hypothetical protein